MGMLAPKPVPRFEQLDAMRWGFAAIVVLGHSAGFYGPIAAGGHAVDFFFVLSGFVLQHSLEQRPTNWARFAAARAARLAPLHFATLFLMVGVFLTTGDGRIPDYDIGATASFLLNLMMLQAVGFKNELSFNFPAWSISTEIVINLTAFYVVSKYRAYAAAGGLALVTYLLLYRHFGAFGHVHTDDMLLFSGGLARTFAGVLAGVSAYGVYRFLAAGLTAPGPRERWIYTGLEAVMLATVLFLMSATANGDKLVLVLLTPATVILFAMGRGWLSRAAALQPFAYLGALSYGVYLIHYPIIVALERSGAIPNDGGTTWVTALLLVGVSTLLAVPVYHGLEIPAKRRLTAFAQQRIAWLERDRSASQTGVRRTMPAE